MNVSVVVPVYNVELYLEKCIRSISEQNYPNEDYEIIAVNDGATDSSPQILSLLQEEITNLVVVKQENQGLSGARNTGFDNAKGKYIICVDSDDYILPEALQFLVKMAEDNDIDILEFGANGVDEKEQTTYSVTASTNKKVYTGEEYLSKISYMYSACNKVYKTAFLNAHALRFMERVFIEDIEFNTRAVHKAQRVMATDYVAAHFLQREGSITRSVNFQKKKKMINDIYAVMNSINNYTENRVTSSSIAYVPLKERISSLIATLLLRVIKYSKDPAVKRDIIDKLRKQNLYPTHFKAETSSKQLFLTFANNYGLLSMVVFLYNTYNRLRYGK